jgi:hypothetical protein
MMACITRPQKLFWETTPASDEKEKALGVTDHMARDSSVPTFSIDKIQANRTGRWKHDEKRLFSQVKTILF